MEPRRRGGSRGLLGFGAKPFIKLDPGDAERPVDPDGRENPGVDLWIELHPDLADAIESSLPPREDRDPASRLFPGSGADALRTSIAKACRALAIPLFSPHDLRHRRISLLHLRGVPWARIGEQVGQRNLAVTANTYTHVMLDEGELDYGALLAGNA